MANLRISWILWEHWSPWGSRHKRQEPRVRQWTWYRWGHKDCPREEADPLSSAPAICLPIIIFGARLNCLLHLTPKYMENETVNLTSSISRICKTSRSTFTYRFGKYFVKCKELLHVYPDGVRGHVKLGVGVQIDAVNISTAVVRQTGEQTCKRCWTMLGMEHTILW